MNLSDILADPKVQALAVATMLSVFSTLHTFLAKQPRLKAFLELAAHVAGPLNLPAMRTVLVALCRAVVEAEDRTQPAPAPATQPAPAPQPAPQPAPGVTSWPTK